MRHIHSFCLPLVIACLTTVLGCRQKNPVEEISASRSGVQVRDLALNNNDLPEMHWAQWRGPSSNGLSDQVGVPTQWSETKNVRWKAQVPGRGHGSPIVVGDTVYLASADEQSEQQSVLAYNRATGDQEWVRTVHKGGFAARNSVHGKSTHANGTIACDGNQLYIAFLNSDQIFVTAINLNGEIEWQKSIGKFVSKHGFAPSPVLYKSLVIVAADNMGGGYLAALDSQTGTIAWRIARGDSSSYSTPTVVRLGGRDQLVISGGNAITSYSPATGEQYWSTACIAEATCGTIVATSDRLFASGGYPDKETVCLSAEGDKLWSNRTKIYEPSMIVLNDQVIAVSDDGIAQCWSTSDGNQIWKKRLGGSVSASPIVVEGRVLVPDLDGNTHVFESKDGAYVSVAKNRLGNDCYASPAVAGGELFLRVGLGSGRDRKEQLVCIANSE